MAVRRLHLQQPEHFAFTPPTERKVKFWLKKYPKGRQASAVIPLLWLAQEQESWVSRPAIEVIAARLDMPVIRVYEVATFYTMFHLKPVGEFHIQLCGTTPCMLRGAAGLKEICREKIGNKQEVTKDGKFSWEEVECLGACVNAPMLQMGSDYFEDLTAESFEKFLDDLSTGKKVKAGPQTERQLSAPQNGPTTLTDPSLYDGSAAKPLKSIPGAPS